jgi:hypothetical protein
MVCPEEWTKTVYMYIYIYIYIYIYLHLASCLDLAHSPLTGLSGVVYIETVQGSSVFQLLICSLAHVMLGRLIKPPASTILNHSVRVCL